MATAPSTPSTPARLPRGAGTVTKAFFAALDAIPDAQRTAVAKAAQGAIREELKRRRDKTVATRGRGAARTGEARPTRASNPGRRSRAD